MLDLFRIRTVANIGCWSSKWFGEPGTILDVINGEIKVLNGDIYVGDITINELNHLFSEEDEFQTVFELVEGKMSNKEKHFELWNKIVEYYAQQLETLPDNIKTVGNLKKEFTKEELGEIRNDCYACQEAIGNHDSHLDCDKCPLQKEACYEDGEDCNEASHYELLIQKVHGYNYSISKLKSKLEEIVQHCKYIQNAWRED